jgi:hypothetical protein
MTSFAAADTLHRLVKEALDSGAAASLEEAQALFHGYRLSFVIGSDEARRPAHQIALLTGVALARRVFLGGVSVSGAVDAPLALPVPHGATVGQGVLALGGQIESIPMADCPVVSIGGKQQPRGRGFHVRTTFSGWSGGIVPVSVESVLEEGAAMPLAPMLAAALAVNEAFLFVRRETGAAGRRAVGMSLWQPEPSYDWLGHPGDEPELGLLPSRLWLIGLGHLGQAYLWALGLLPYADPSGLSLVLQDVDVVTPSTESTSILTDATLVGQKKTRAMAAWAGRRGFTTAIHERLFDNTFTRQETEPTIALCGLDNALGRQALDHVGFEFVVEAGLGRGYQDFRTMRLHTLPGSRTAAEIWKAAPSGESVVDRAAYRKLLEEGALDRCGATLLAGKAVGAPFVGAVAACLAVAEVLRLLNGGPLYQFVDLDLQSVEHRVAVPQQRDLGSLNPGFVVASASRAWCLRKGVSKTRRLRRRLTDD